MAFSAAKSFVAYVRLSEIYCSGLQYSAVLGSEATTHAAATTLSTLSASQRALVTEREVDLALCVLRASKIDEHLFQCCLAD